MMSGGIFQPPIAEEVEEFKRNPLLCYLCNELYEQPCLLKCFHSFCARCLRGRATDGKMVCPLCSALSIVSDELPPCDPLLKFLVESSSEDKVECSNCDQADKDMYFCMTCDQPLCQLCRDDTHKAKMFRKHEIVKMCKRTKDIHRKCNLHAEPYIMFCKPKKTMLCIICFRDTSVEMRSQCVDLDTAYNQGCKKLDQAVQAIGELQNSVRAGIKLLRSLSDEVRRNCQTEKEAITSLYISMQEKITDKKNVMLEEADRQYVESQQVFKEQLSTLNALLPTLHINLVTCTAFSSSANKYEFLDLAYILIRRLHDIADLPHPIHPLHSSSIHTDYKMEFGRCLESLLSFRSVSSYVGKNLNGNNQNNNNSGKRLESSPVPGPMTGPVGYGYANGGRRCTSSKVMYVEARGAFAEHCKEADNKYKEIMQRFDKLKIRVQELQRDLTLRRCLTKDTKVTNIVEECESVGTELDNHLQTLEKKRPLLEQHWQETCQMIADEQEIYQAQLSDTMRVRRENEHVKVITKQLEPFIKTISAVTEKLAPRLSTSKNKADKSGDFQSLLEQISTMNPDSQQRVDAIQAAQEDRQTQIANKTNPLDDALIKTKEMLKTPSSHKDSSGNRLSDPWLEGKTEGLLLGRVLDDVDIAVREKQARESNENTMRNDKENKAENDKSETVFNDTEFNYTVILGKLGDYDNNDSENQLVCSPDESMIVNKDTKDDRTDDGVCSYNETKIEYSHGTLSKHDDDGDGDNG